MTAITHHCILRILTTAGQWPGCQEPAAGRYPLQPLQWRALQTRPVLQCCSVTRGAHTRFADICTPLQLQTAAAWPPPGSRMSGPVLSRVTIHSPARHCCPAHRDKHFRCYWQLMTGCCNFGLLNRVKVFCMVLQMSKMTRVQFIFGFSHSILLLPGFALE